MTREELKQMAHKAYKRHISNGGFGSKFDFINGYMACANERNQWHNVSDELPPRIKETVNISKAVLVTNGLSYGTGYYNYNLNKWFCVGATNITHWMKLPELPKEKED